MGWRRVLIVSATLIACEPAPSVAPTDAALRCAADDACVDGVLEEFCRARFALGAVLVVQLEDGSRHYGVCGHADRARTRPMVATDRFRVGSITKTFTATLVLGLVDEGTLALDTTPDDHGIVTDAGDATLEQLLRNTAGLADYNSDAAFDWSRSWTMPQVIDWVTSERDPVAAPGVAFGYSGTHFLVAAEIAAAGGRPTYATALRARVLGPLGLDDTYVDGDEPVAGGRVEGSHPIGIDPGPPIHTNDWTAADGSVVSNADDVLDLFEHLFVARDVLAPATLDRMTTPTALPDGTTPYFIDGEYGMGVQILEAPEGPIYAHGGLDFGFTAWAGVQPATHRGVVVLLNTDGANPRELAGIGWDLLREP